jgi:hypothetical protein
MDIFRVLPIAGQISFVMRHICSILRSLYVYSPFSGGTADDVLWNPRVLLNPDGGTLL